MFHVDFINFFRKMPIGGPEDGSPVCVVHTEGKLTAGLGPLGGPPQESDDLGLGAACIGGELGGSCASGDPLFHRPAHGGWQNTDPQAHPS